MVDRYELHRFEGMLQDDLGDYVRYADYDAQSKTLFAAQQAVLTEGLRANRYEAALKRLQAACIESGDNFYAHIATEALSPQADTEGKSDAG